MTCRREHVTPEIRRVLKAAVAYFFARNFEDEEHRADLLIATRDYLEKKNGRNVNAVADQEGKQKDKSSENRAI